MKKIYTQKINQYKTKEALLENSSKLYFYGKLFSFIGAVFLAYLSYKDFSNIKIITCAAFVVAYIVSYLLDDKCRSEINYLRRLQQVCNNEIAYFDEDFSAFRTGDRYIDLEHEYSFDLDIFGESSLFHRINRTVTQKGSDRLAEKLSVLSKDANEIRDNQQAIAELSSLLDWRIKFTANSFVRTNLSLLAKHIETNKNKSNAFLVHSIMPYLLIAITSILFLLCLIGVLSWSYFVGMFLFQILITTFVGKSVSKSNLRVDLLLKEYKGYLNILSNISEIDFNSEVLKNIKKNLFYSEVNCFVAFQKLSKILDLFDQRANVVMYVVLNGTVLYDILLVRMFEKWCEKYLPYVESWIDSIAEVDALVSLSTYAFNNPINVYPELLNNASECVIDAKDVFHPFLAHKRAVPNSFTLKRNNIAIITGANMAGKSTFLRTIGVTYVLACSGAPVCAKSFKFSIVSLFSSMRTADDLSRDISYFNAELLRLKQLIEYVKTHDFTLIILDEILKGTNSKDKLKGSIMFLDKLSKYNISSLIATHDLMLAKLEEQDGEVYKNYCFEIELSEKITYTYKIEKGVAQNLNASYLLSNILRDL